MTYLKLKKEDKELSIKDYHAWNGLLNNVIFSVLTIALFVSMLGYEKSIDSIIIYTDYLGNRSLDLVGLLFLLIPLIFITLAVYQLINVCILKKIISLKLNDKAPVVSYQQVIGGRNKGFSFVYYKIVVQLQDSEHNFKLSDDAFIRFKEFLDKNYPEIQYNQA